MPSVAHIDATLAGLLPPGSLFAVGGRVRDEIRAEIEGHRALGTDLDFVVTGLSVDDLLAKLRPAGRIDVVGASFAVIKMTLDGSTFDIALARRERSVGTGHRDFLVQSGPEVTLEEDLARRDFRMNMLARAIPGGEIIDPYGGIADIRAHRIDLLKSEAFAEDPLRMLRAAQFAGRFEYLPTPSLMDAMTQAAPLVSTVSPERIAGELTKLLILSARPSIGLELLRRTGVLGYVWPELLEGVGVEQNEWHAYDVWHHAMATVDASPPGDIILRLAALLHDIGKPRTKDGPHFYRHESVGAEIAREMLERLRFSSDVGLTTAHLVAQHMFSADPEMSDPALRRFIRRAGPDSIERLFALREADVRGSGLPRRNDDNERFAERVRAELERKPAFSVRDLAIDGQDVLAALVRTGVVEENFGGDRRVGDALRWLFEQVTEEPERNERTLLLNMLETYVEHAYARSS